MLFVMYEAIIQCLNYTGQETKKEKLAVCVFDTPVTAKQGRGHWTWYDMIDCKQGYNPANLERPHLNSVQEKDNI